MKLGEDIEFRFLSPQFEGNPPRVPAISSLDLATLAKEILGPSRAEEEERPRRFRTQTSAADMDEQASSALADSPTSRFTAVNEKEIGTGNGSGSRRGSDEKSNGGQPRITPPGQEKLTITTTPSQREDWAARGNGDGGSYSGAGAAYSNESSHKRKRSGSVEQNSSSANSYHTHALPSSTKETPTTASTEPDMAREDSLRQAQSERDSHYPDGYSRFLASADEGREIWARQYPSQQLGSDDHLGEVLQRASQSMESHHHQEYDPDSPGDADRSANPYSAHGYDRREMSASSDPKKRKRNFSNRTKTGCMTCRRRKKKCDETRPECMSMSVLGDPHRFGVHAIFFMVTVC